MKLVARYDSIGYRVPGGETLWLEVDGRLVGVHSRPAYLHTDGTLEPGLLRSPIATEIRVTNYPGECPRVCPIVCASCRDTGQGHDTDECEACRGLGDELNLRTCTYCDKVQYYPAPFLPVAPRETLNHPLLLKRMHDSCAVESTVAHVAAERAA